jgi:hypothetical protein
MLKKAMKRRKPPGRRERQGRDSRGYCFSPPGVVGVLAVPLPFFSTLLVAAVGCGRSSTVEGVPAGSAHSSPASSPADPGLVAAPVAGRGCVAGRDSVACSPDGLEEISCAGGLWRTIQSCRGPGHCQGAASKLTCDPGEPQPGDACIVARSAPRCLGTDRLLACTDGRWLPSSCPAGRTCTPGGDASADALTAACR